MKRLALAFAVAALLVAAMAPAALATTTRYYFVDTVQAVNVDPGVITTHGNALTIRDQVNSQPVLDEVLGPGTDTNYIDANVNLLAGTGEIRGKTVIWYPYAQGGWDCTFTGVFDPAKFGFNGVSATGFTAREVCQGTGLLTGAQLKGWFHTTGNPGEITLEGFWTVPGDRNQ